MRSFGYVILTCLSLASIGVSVLPIAPKLIWNASASVPIGLYAVHAIDDLEVDALVAVKPPLPLARFLDRRGYLPLGAPLLKRVAALPGQQVCRTDRTIVIDGRIAGEAHWRDSDNRSLPIWQGCRLIAKDEVFLMNETVPDSLDGRYFGPVSARTLIGRAVPIITDEDGDGAFEWRSFSR